MSEIVQHSQVCVVRKLFIMEKYNLKDILLKLIGTYKYLCAVLCTFPNTEFLDEKNMRIQSQQNKKY